MPTVTLSPEQCNLFRTHGSRLSDAKRDVFCQTNLAEGFAFVASRPQYLFRALYVPAERARKIRLPDVSYACGGSEAYASTSPGRTDVLLTFASQACAHRPVDRPGARGQPKRNGTEGQAIIIL